MPLSIEHLPVEIWLMILTYIEANDLQKAFSNLNSFFTRLLQSSSLRVTMNITVGGCKAFNASQYSLHPEIFEALHANLNGTSDLLAFLDSVDPLPNLRSLSLHIRRQKNSRLLLSVLEKHPCLQHLSISCAMYNVDDGIVPIFNEIFKLPQLRRCELQLSRNASHSSHFAPHLSISNSLRHFYFNSSISSASVCHLVQFMPSLRILHLYFYRRRYNRDDWDFISSPEMTEKGCTSFIVKHLYLEDLAKAAPNLIYLYTSIEPYDRSSYIFKKCNVDPSRAANVHDESISKINRLMNQLHTNILFLKCTRQLFDRFINCSVKFDGRFEQMSDKTKVQSI